MSNPHHSALQCLRELHTAAAAAARYNLSRTQNIHPRRSSLPLPGPGDTYGTLLQAKLEVPRGDTDITQAGAKAATVSTGPGSAPSVQLIAEKLLTGDSPSRVGLNHGNHPGAERHNLRDWCATRVRRGK
ncbi:hypothetical protein A1F99_141440 [Pyrenophora tritici-repentis]|nr:hypothetical protein A1F99_141440 [Pyrenophora tritici-repentis]